MYVPLVTKMLCVLNDMANTNVYVTKVMKVMDWSVQKRF